MTRATELPASTVTAAREIVEEHDRRNGHLRTGPRPPTSTADPAPRTDSSTAADDEDPTTWERVDLSGTLAAIRAGTVQRPQPTVGRLTDGSALFYAGRINALFAPSGEGKSMIVHAVAVQEIKEGHDVLWVDLEDDEVGTLTRLVELGATDHEITEHFHYHWPELPTSYRVYDQLAEILEGGGFRLAVVDSLGEFMALHKVKDEDGPVAEMMRGLPRFLANHGPAVVPLDHVTKTKERGPKEFAIGSQRKRAAVSGAAYEAQQFQKLADGEVGKIKLLVAKDRFGFRKKGAVAAEITVDSTGDDIRVEFDPPALSVNAEGNFRPTTLMARASRWLEENPGGHSKSAVLVAVEGKREGVSIALDRLVEEGYVDRRQEGQKQIHVHTKRFDDE